MRVLHVIRTLDPASGGPVEGVRQISVLSERYGVDAEVVCQDDPKSSWLATWVVPIHPIGKCLSTFGYTKRLDLWLAENVTRFDALVVHGIWMYLSLATWKAATQKHVPYYLFTHGFLDPWFRRKYPHKHVKKMLYWRLYEHKVLRDAAAVLFTTEEEKRLAENAFQPYRCNTVVVGFGATSPDITEKVKGCQTLIQSLSASHPDLKGRRFILYLGRIHEKKGIDLLLGGFANLKDQDSNLALLIAGPGDATVVDELKSLGRNLGLGERVVWTGPLYDQEKWDAMKAADVFVLPSHQENFGVSVAEALACGTPVLISNKVNIWREVDRAGAGLVETDDLEGTTRLLQRWHHLNPEEKERMSKNARSCFSSHFDMTTSCRQLFELLRKGCATPLQHRPGEGHRVKHVQGPKSLGLIQ
jgi:glycosyltransferase involved in cell wall biosynthesis